VNERSGNRVCIRSLQSSDLTYTLRWRNDPRSRFWFKTNAVIEQASHLAWFQRYQFEAKEFMFFVETIDGASPVGQGGIYNVDQSRGDAEVGRFLSDPELRGKGLFREGLGLIVQYAFDDLGLESVYLEVMSNNDRAVRLYRSLGFCDTGEREHMLHMRLSRDRFAAHCSM